MRTRRLMVLGARLAQLPMFHAARRQGLSILAADPDPSAPGLALADAHVCCDLADVDALVAAAREHTIDGVVTTAADYPMPALAVIAQALGLRGARPEAVHRATNKAAMREAFRRAGVPSPASWLVRSFEEASQLRRGAAASIDDLILKPVRSSGGRGVTRVTTDSDDLAHKWALRRAFDHAAAYSTRSEGVILEEYIDGPEFSIETLSWGGRSELIAITDKHTSGAPHYVEIGHEQPSQCDAEQRLTIARTAMQAIDALGIDDAAGHTEIRVGPAGPVLMEAAARCGGGTIASHLVPLSTGIDMLSACISVALGDEPNLGSSMPRRAAAVRFVVARPGMVEALHGLADARQMPGVVDVQFYCRPGQTIGALRDATARCGHVVAASSCTPSAMELADRALSKLVVETRE